MAIGVIIIDTALTNVTPFSVKLTVVVVLRGVEFKSDGEVYVNTALPDASVVVVAGVMEPNSFPITAMLTSLPATPTLVLLSTR